ncbi:MAG: hypothetical protein OES32_14780 [Acidobacteriota bacterium]|nr:hypothetical protein [Acidobacteriota bacterium]MDH3524846.1 hypothetical protein [Acidobacteriota bacterium]
MIRFLEPGGWVVAYAVAAAAWLAWAVRVEAPGRRAAWRVAALAAAAGGLFLLAARPASRAPARERGAILVTPGASPAAVSALAAGSELFVMPGASARGAAPARDVALLARDRPEVTHWRIAGVGLAPWDVETLPGRVSFAAPAAPRPGVDRAVWPRALALGEELVVAGSVATGGGSAVLELAGPAGGEGAVELAPGATAFELRARPRREGRQLYRLSLALDGVPVASEAVDVAVGPRDPPAVLWIEGAPGFETRSVKGWLRDVDAALVVRSRVSRDRFRHEAFNHEPVDAGRLTPELLAGFDLAVVDGGSWSALPRSDREALRTAVAAGLGLLMPAVAEPGDALGAPFEGFEIAAVADLEEREVRGSGPGLAPLAPLVIPAREILAGPGGRVLVRDEAERALAAVSRYGRGAAAISVLAGTYRWVLRGEAPSHRRYWSRLLAAVARPRSLAVEWLLPGGPVFVDEPLAVALLAPARWALTVTVTGPEGGTRPLPTVQDVVEPRLWRAELRPRAAGWHRLTAGDAESWLWVQEPSAWPAWRDRRALAATSLRAARGAAAPGPAAARVARPWPRGGLLALLATALAALWAHERWLGAPPGGRPTRGSTA